MFKGVEITSNVKRDKTRQIFIFFVQLSFFPAFLPCRSLVFFPSGVDRAVLLGTGLAFQQLCSPLVPQKSCCALVPVWAGQPLPTARLACSGALSALAVEESRVMHAQWWQQSSHMCSIVLQYLCFHGYHRNCRFAVQISGRDSEHQPMCCSCLILTPLCWAQTCCSLAGLGCWAPAGAAALLGSSGEFGCTHQPALVWLWAVRFLSRKGRSAF